MFCISKCLSQRKTFYIMMVLTTSMFLVEIIVGYLTESMALVADSFHMLSDLISLFVGYISMKVKIHVLFFYQHNFNYYYYYYFFFFDKEILNLFWFDIYKKIFYRHIFILT